MIMMARYPDKFFELAIVDPPYGIGVNHMGGRGGKSTWKGHTRKDWDNYRPSGRYFDELFRVSKNQIIWGANYFPEYLKSSMGWIFWDKMNDSFSTSDGEFAYTSFSNKAKAFRRMANMDKGFMNKEGGDIHPTQKPIQLYKWLLTNYAKPGDKILDTHLGSGSSRIAAYNMGFDFWGCELDPDYFAAAEKRFKEQTMQQSLFAPDIIHSSYPGE